MIVNFHLEYRTEWGEEIAIHLRRSGKESTLIFQAFDGLNWTASLEVAENETIEYQYFLKKGESESPEFGKFRKLNFPKGQNHYFVQDYWRPSHWAEQAFFSAAFQDVIFRRTAPAKKRKSTQQKNGNGNKIIFRLNAAAISADQVFCLLGSGEELGNWETPILLSEKNYPIWSAEILTKKKQVNFEYKYAIYDLNEKKIIEWEEGKNRNIRFNFNSENGNAVIRTDERFHYSSSLWRGAGVAIPVFSLRSKNGLGIGEFADLKLMVDWAVKANMKLVQVLPVNDTIGSKTWKDSYPYRAISVFALHPLFVNLEGIAPIKDKKAATRLKKIKTELNQLEAVDFEKTMAAKMDFFQLIYEQEKAVFKKNKAAKKFISENAEWLKPYAAFCFFRDKYGTVNFNEWGEHAIFSEKMISKICSPRAKTFDEINFHYFIQFHAHQQLHGATEYARQNRVILKGDLPIGIGRHSCDAWVAPELYNMDGQAGAPPDYYSENGQNWGFPTYNWEEMAKDNFSWWRNRMGKLAEYFDALRIDHILGFFRIWQIPTDQVIGTMGVYNPRMPYTRNELANFGVQGDLSRYTMPYIQDRFLNEIFGDDTEFVKTHFLDEIKSGIFNLKPESDTQVKIKALFEKEEKLKGKSHLMENIMRLVSEVLLLTEPDDGGMKFNPRITIENTRSFKELNEREQSIFLKTYNDYHFNRHDEYWRDQALWKLPPLLRATNMLICGEDLGMIPASVAGVMEKLNILTLEIQRVPKGDTKFGLASEYPYTSVASPSCHDMSTVRGWWEEDYERSSIYFQKFIDKYMPAPLACTAEIVQAINEQHINSPSMWAIFPLQDLVGMDEKLRRENADDEQINQPSNPEHYWRFRFHIPLEKLIEENELNEKVRYMVEEAGR